MVTTSMFVGPKLMAENRDLNPLDNNRYAIFGEPVFSPCDGTIVVAVDGIEDTPPASSPDSWFPAGNHVVIECGQTSVTLVHLKMDSVRTQAGETVVTGRGIGSVGNSGNRTVPYLHIHAETADGRGVPILFDGRFLVRNTVVLVR